MGPQCWLYWLDLLHVFETFRMFTEVCATVLKLHNESDFHNPSWFISTVDVLCHNLMMSHNSQNKKIYK